MRNLLEEIDSLVEENNIQEEKIRNLFSALDTQLSASLSKLPFKFFAESEFGICDKLDDEDFESIKLCFDLENGLHFLKGDTYQYTLEPHFRYTYEVIKAESLPSKALFRFLENRALNSLMKNILSQLSQRLNILRQGNDDIQETLESLILSIEEEFKNATRDTKYKEIGKKLQDARRKLHESPEESLLLANTFLEETFKYILSEDDGDSQENICTAVALFKAVKKKMDISGDRTDSEQLKRILGGLSNIVAGVDSLRTRKSNAHGRAPVHLPPTYSDAWLSVSAAGVVATYLVSFMSQENAEIPENLD